jgi:hypothetical protein
VIRLSDNTEISFKQLGMADIVVEQTQGIAFHRINDQTTAIYRVINDNTELTALGTGFNVKAASGLTFVTVTENRVKAKIYDGENILNMRTIDSGTEATINPGLDLEKMIQTKSVNASNLIDDAWYSWNLEQDTKNKYYLGIFAETTKLVITEPTQAEMTTDEDKITIKGATNPEAEIFIGGQELDNSGGNFEMEYKLGAGDNEILIVVKKGKNRNQKTLKIKSTKQAEILTLKGAILDNKDASLSWETENLDEFDSFKLLHGTSETKLTYPQDDQHSLDTEDSTDKWTSLEDGEHFFRLCAYSEEDKCFVYSNQINLTVGSDGDDPVEDEDTVPVEISLSASLSDNDVSLTWNITGSLSDYTSIRTVTAQANNPVYPGNSSQSMSIDKTSDTWADLNPGTYYFRVCLMKGDLCAKYSSSVSKTIEPSVQGSIILSAAAMPSGVDLTWSPQNISSGASYYVIMKQSPNVVFPGEANQLRANTNFFWTGLTSGQTYYFRVCEKQGDGCGTYSNEYSATIK